MAYKVLIARGDVGGTVDYRKAVIAKVGSDLESQLNAENIENVLSVAPYSSDHEFILVAAVVVADQPQGE